MTKNDIRACVRQIENLSDAAHTIGTMIADGNEQVEELLTAVIDGRRTDVDNVSEKIIDIIEENYHLIDGPEIERAAFKLRQSNLDYSEMRIPVGKGALICNFGIADYGTKQIDVMYETPDEDFYDVCLVEVKKGELAKLHDLKPDNEAADVYIADENDMLRVARLSYPPKKA